jgi:hypothetical protein
MSRIWLALCLIGMLPGVCAVVLAFARPEGSQFVARHFPVLTKTESEYRYTISVSVLGNNVTVLPVPPSQLRVKLCLIVVGLLLYACGLIAFTPSVTRYYSREPASSSVSHQP